MCGGEMKTEGGFVSLADHIVNYDSQVRKRIDKPLPEPPKSHWARQFLLAIGESVGDAIGSKQLIDGRLTTLVPDLFKPSSRKGGKIGHGAILQDWPPKDSP